MPGYRGYTIDSIRQLTILDDMRISADEKHFFKGLSKLKGNIYMKHLIVVNSNYKFCESNLYSIQECVQIKYQLSAVVLGFIEIKSFKGSSSPVKNVVLKASHLDGGDRTGKGSNTSILDNCFGTQ